VHIGDGVTILPDNIFSDFPELTTVILGDGITSIGEGAFTRNDKLTSVTLGRNVTEIGDDAFSWAGTISEFTIQTPIPPEINNTVFGNSSIETLYVPAESVELYRKSDWNNKCSNIIGI
jgi:hypothetical protein